MVSVKGRMFPIFDFAKPKRSDYIVIEVLGMPAGKNFSVVRLPENYSLEIGRSSAEMNIPDVSISKQQSTLKYDSSIGELVIQDMNSKYGTHILIQRPMRMALNEPIYLLNGLSLMKLTLKNSFMSGLCRSLCLKSSSKYVIDQAFYSEVKYKMPHDLMRYRAEENRLSDL